MGLLSKLFGHGRRDVLERAAQAIRTVVAGKRLPDMVSRTETDRQLENRLRIAIERKDDDEYGRILSAILTAPLIHRRDQIAKLLPEEEELASIGLPNALARLLFGAFRTGWRSSQTNPLHGATEARDRELAAILASSLAARHSEAAMRLDDYFKNASAVFAELGHLPAKIAAIAAAAASDTDLRQIQIGHLRLVSLSLVGTRKAAILTALADEISARDWSIEDVKQKKRELRAVDAELADCLDDSDPSLFARRWPELFDERSG